MLNTSASSRRRPPGRVRPGPAPGSAAWPGSPAGDAPCCLPDNHEQGSSGNQGEDLYIYPAQGQSEQQQADDRYECHRWAVDETGYDPTESDYDADRRVEHLRAMTACLTGRGYSVR